MFYNYHEITLKDAEGSPVVVKLRLTIGAQIALNKKYKEDGGSRQILFAAMNDPEKFVTVLEHALKWKGNDNTITDGAELADMLINNGMLGVLNQQLLLVDIGCASGLFSKEEAESLTNAAQKDAKRTFGDEEEDEKN